MTEEEIREKELKYMIEDSVDSSVERAFKKYGRGRRGFGLSLSGIVSIVLLIAVMFMGYKWYEMQKASEHVTPIEEHDLTLENNSIFGFAVVDFQEPVLEKAVQQRLLIVEEQEAYVGTSVTETGLFNLGVFNKEQMLTIHGTGQYTIDLTQVKARDISLDEENYELTICIPHAKLHNVSYDPEKTEIGDLQRGWLAFGDLKLTAEQQNVFEVGAKQELEAKLSESERFAEADRFAKLEAYEMYQAIVRTISPAYKVVIEFQQ